MPISTAQLRTSPATKKQKAKYIYINNGDNNHEYPQVQIWSEAPRSGLHQMSLIHTMCTSPCMLSASIIYWLANCIHDPNWTVWMLNIRWMWIREQVNKCDFYFFFLSHEKIDTYIISWKQRADEFVRLVLSRSADVSFLRRTLDGNDDASRTQ